MSKTNVHMNLDTALHDAIRRYATGHGLNFTAAISVLAARGLRDEGIIIQEGASTEIPLRRRPPAEVRERLLGVLPEDFVDELVKGDDHDENHA